MAIKKHALIAVFVSAVLLQIFLPAPLMNGQDNIDPLCKQLGICKGYSYTFLSATSGGDLFVTDQKVLAVPKGATFSSALPFCSVYYYDSNGDDDAGWECTWKKFTDDISGRDAFIFRLTSLNSRNNATATVQAVAVILDANIFKVNEDWIFSTSSSATRKIKSSSLSSSSVTIYTVDTYDTDGDDDFTFMLGYQSGQKQFYAETAHGGSGSYIHGQILNITPPSSMFACQANFYLKNNSSQRWNSASDSTCGNLRYSTQFPLVFPSLYRYYSAGDDVDEDFRVHVSKYGIFSSGSKTWAEIAARMESGNKDSTAYLQMTVLGYR